MIVGIKGPWTPEAAGGDQSTSGLTVGTRACWASLVPSPELILPRPGTSSLPEEEGLQEGV